MKNPVKKNLGGRSPQESAESRNQPRRAADSRMRDRRQSPSKKRGVACVRLSLSDADTWPLRMTREEIAYVLRMSKRSLEQRLTDGRFPPADDLHTWSRDFVKEYATKRMKEFERMAKRHGLRAVR